MRCVFISDTHGRHDFQIPDGDILFHAGDLCMRGDLNEVTREAKWLKGVKIGGGFKHVVAICGNHDGLFESDPALARLLMEENGIDYLQHQAKEIMGLKVFGSPYTPRFFDWHFNVDRGPKLAALWAQIPADTQVLITHGPPHGRLDTVKRPDGDPDSEEYSTTPKERLYDTHAGCLDLAWRIHDLKDLRVHCFGHIHRPGMEKGADGIAYINASTCNERYLAVHAPQTLDL